ncbi:hypothetical protein ACEE86_16590, partial [Proteus mirabilis]
EVHERLVGSESCIRDSLLGGHVATFTAPPEGITDPLQTLPIYTDVFGKIGIVTLVVGLIMWATVPLLNRMMKEESKMIK